MRSNEYVKKGSDNIEGTGQAAIAGLWYLICNIIIKGLSFLTTPIFTRLMTQDEYGIVAAYNSCLSIVSVIATLDLYACIQISKKDFRENNHAFVSSVTFLSTISIAFFYLIAKIYAIYTEKFFGLPVNMIDIMFIYIIFENAFNIRQTFLQSYLKYKEFSICAVGFAIASVLLGILLVNNFSNDKYWGRIIGNTVAMAMIGSYSLYRTFSAGKCLINKRFWKYALTFSLPLIAHHISGTVLSSFDRMMINDICGASSAAVYSLAYNIGAIIQVLWYSFNRAWTPWFYDRLSEDNVSKIKKAAKPYILMFCACIFIAVPIAPEVIKILGPSEYWEGKWVVPPVALGLFFQFIYSMYVNIEMYHKKTKMIAIGTIAAALLNVVLNYIFIPIYGYIAASYTTLVGYIVLFIFHFAISKRIEKRDLLDDKFVYVVILFMCLSTIGMTALYNDALLRYIAIVIVLTYLLITNINKIKIHIEKIKKKLVKGS